MNDRTMPEVVELRKLVAELRECRTDYDGSIMPDDAEPIGVTCGLLCWAEVAIEDYAAAQTPPRSEGVVTEAEIEAACAASYACWDLVGYYSERRKQGMRGKMQDALTAALAARGGEQG